MGQFSCYAGRDALRRGKKAQRSTDKHYPTMAKNNVSLADFDQRIEQVANNHRIKLSPEAKREFLDQILTGSLAGITDDAYLKFLTAELSPPIWLAAKFKGRGQKKRRGRPQGPPLSHDETVLGVEGPGKC